MYCYFCSARIDEGSSYCRNCGTESIIDFKKIRPVTPFRIIRYFVLGTMIYAFLLVAISAIVAQIFPTGGPQLVILIGALLGAIASGFLAAQVVSKRPSRTSTLTRNVPPEINKPDVFELPNHEPLRVPKSVIESTTTKLTIDR